MNKVISYLIPSKIDIRVKEVIKEYQSYSPLYNTSTEYENFLKQIKGPQLDKQLDELNSKTAKIPELLHTTDLTNYRKSGIAYISGYPLIKMSSTVNEYKTLQQELKRIMPNYRVYNVEETHLSLKVPIRIEKTNSPNPEDYVKKNLENYKKIFDKLSNEQCLLKAYKLHLFPTGELVIIWIPVSYGGTTDTRNTIFDLRKKIHNEMMGVQILSDSQLDFCKSKMDLVHSTIGRIFKTEDLLDDLKIKKVKNIIKDINEDLSTGAFMHLPIVIDNIHLAIDTLHPDIKIDKPEDYNKFHSIKIIVSQ